MKAKILFLVLILTTASCSTVQNEPSDISGEDLSQTLKPDWMRFLPVDSEFFYGIGISKSLEEAKFKSIIDAGQQFNIQVDSVILESSRTGNNGTKSAIDMMNRQLTDHVVHGIKFIDQYEDEKGNYWILARAPIDCMMDFTESILLSYSLEMNQDRKEILSLVKMIEGKTQNPDERVSSSDVLYRQYMYEDLNYNHQRIRALKIRKIPDQNVRFAQDLKRLPWDQMYFAYNDEHNDNSDDKPFSDLSEVRFAFDNEYLYIKVDLHKGEPTNKSSWYQSNIWQVDNDNQFFDFSLRYLDTKWVSDIRVVNRNSNTNQFEWQDLYRDLCVIDGNSIIGRARLDKLNIKDGVIRRISTYTHNDDGGYDGDYTDEEYLYFVAY